jgi:hypothetical protein
MCFLGKRDHASPVNEEFQSTEHCELRFNPLHQTRKRSLYGNNSLLV